MYTYFGFFICYKFNEARFFFSLWSLILLMKLFRILFRCHKNERWILLDSRQIWNINMAFVVCCIIKILSLWRSEVLSHSINSYFKSQSVPKRTEVLKTSRPFRDQQKCQIKRINFRWDKYVLFLKLTADMQRSVSFYLR